MITYCPKCEKEILQEGYHNEIRPVMFNSKLYVHYELYQCLDCDILWGKEEGAREFRVFLKP